MAENEQTVEFGRSKRKKLKSLVTVAEKNKKRGKQDIESGGGFRKKGKAIKAGKYTKRRLDCS
jgi:hypothetical protein